MDTKNTTYTDEVKKHFLNPHNMGDMKKADGVGKLGNPVCLIPESRILTADGFKEIRSIKKGEDVIGHDGKTHQILQVSKRQYTDNVLEIKNKLGTTTLTSDHIIYSIKIPKTQRFRLVNNKKKLVPAWYHANELKKGDFIAYSVPKTEMDINYIISKQEKKFWDHNSNKIPEKIPVTGDLLRFMGYYIAEGCSTDKPSKVKLSFCFNLKEKHLAEDVEKITKKIFGIDVKHTERINHNTRIVEINNVWITRLIRDLIGQGAEHKKIPEQFMQLPINKQKELIKGLWLGDGYFNTERPRAGYTTISKELIEQLKILLIRQEIIPSIYLDKEKIRKGINHKPSYRIHIGERESLEKLAKILGIEFKNTMTIKQTSWIDNKYLYTPIKNIKKISYDGKVHNLEIKDVHSYLTNSLTVHNCGDVFWLYISVGKNKKGEEIIKDIKFQTMGCAAAISTSSMITDLAKGKTLTEAMKITNKDVADSLKGLPPIKMHCSNMAADTLHEAIKDYLSKKVKDKEGKKIKTIKKEACYRCCHK